MRRFTFAVIAGVAGWDARPLRGAAPIGEGVTVGSQRVAPEAIEAAAARIAGHRSRPTLCSLRGARRSPGALGLGDCLVRPARR